MGGCQCLLIGEIIMSSACGKAQLNFNVLAKISGSTRASFDKIIDGLKAYKAGYPGKPCEGYARIHFDYDQDSSFPNLRGKLNHVVGVSRVHDSFSKKASFLPGSKKQQLTYYPQTSCTDIYWIGKDILAIAGPEESAIKSHKWFKKVMKSNTVEYLFSDRFLVWLLWQQYEKKYDVGHGLRIDFISHAVTVGKVDRIGARTRVDDCPNISEAVQSVITILWGKRISEIVCGMAIDDQWKSMITITEHGKIGCMLTKGSLNRADVPSRVGIGLLGIEKVLKVFDEWSNLPPKSKYPPGTFFSSLASDAESVGYIIYSKSVQDLVDEYDKLRKGRK